MFIFLLTKAQRPSIQISNFKLIINYNTANLFQFAKIIKTSQINKHKHKKFYTIKVILLDSCIHKKHCPLTIGIDH